MLGSIRARLDVSLRHHERARSRAEVSALALAFFVVIALAVAGSALGRAERFHSLRAVERAFYAAHVPFSTDWQARPVNPYLVPRPSGPRKELQPRFRPHLIGWAAELSSKTFRGRQVWVFDGAAIAGSYQKSLRAHCAPQPSCSRKILRANNVVYQGTNRSRVAEATMRKLRHE